MAADGNSARNDQEKDDEGDPVLSMVDYLKEEEALEDDAEAVLGDSDENQCTHSLVNSYGCMEIQEWTRERTGMDTGTDRNGHRHGPEWT